MKARQLLFAAVLGASVFAGVPTLLESSLLAVGPPLAGEIVPRQIPYRGFIAVDGVPLTSTQTELGFFVHFSDGGVGWSQVIQTSVVRGDFEVVLGDDGGLPSSLLDDPGCWLNVQVNPSSQGPTLVGSQRLLSVAFAHRAAAAATARTAETATNAAFATTASNATSAQSAATAVVAATANRAARVVVGNPDGGGTISVGGFYCGLAPSRTGDWGGPRAGKAFCENTCGSSTAHVCLREEVSRSFLIGIAMPAGQMWIADPVFPIPYGGGYIDDCLSRTTSTSGHLGAAWQSPLVTSAWCTESWPVACCD